MMELHIRILQNGFMVQSVPMGTGSGFEPILVGYLSLVKEFELSCKSAPIH